MNSSFKSDFKAGPSRHKGYALILGLLLILVMTVFSVFAMNGSILQERMAGNQLDHKRSFEAAEIALRWGEAWLQSRTPFNRPFPCRTLVQDSNQNCNDSRQVLEVNLLAPGLEDLDPWACGDEWSNARRYGEDPSLVTEVNCSDEVVETDWSVAEVHRQPRFLMEQAYVDRDDLAGNPQQGRIFYRIISSGMGSRTSSRTVVESKVAKRYE